MPVYNVEKYVAECLESLLQLDDAEIIVVNDGSSDSSLEVVVGIQQRNKNIKVITQENAGLSAARNSGLMACTGDYVYFVDSDDIANDFGVSEAYDYAKKKNLDIAQCHIEVFKSRRTAASTNSMPSQSHTSANFSTRSSPGVGCAGRQKTDTGSAHPDPHSPPASRTIEPEKTVWR